MNNTREIDVATLRELMWCNFETGELFWHVRDLKYFGGNETTMKSWNTRYAGKKAGCLSPKGYMKISIFDVTYMAHRVIYALYHNEWPTHEIDHDNGIRYDNRIANLKAVTHIQNCRNLGIMKHNTSGVSGVSWNKKKQTWVSYIDVNGKKIHLGYNKIFENAVKIRLDAEIEHGFNPNHGKRLAYG